MVQELLPGTGGWGVLALRGSGREEGVGLGYNSTANPWGIDIEGWLEQGERMGSQVSRKSHTASLLGASHFLISSGIPDL